MVCGMMGMLSFGDWEFWVGVLGGVACDGLGSVSDASPEIQFVVGCVCL